MTTRAEEALACMILDSRAMIGPIIPTAGDGVVGTMTAATGQTTAGSIAHLLADGGSTAMACGPRDFPHVALRPTPQRATHSVRHRKYGGRNAESTDQQEVRGCGPC